MNRDEIIATFDSVAEDPYGAARTDLCRRMVASADALGEERLSYDTRIVLIESAIFGGSAEEAIVAFSWCVAKSKEDPETFPMGDWDSDLLWMYKWIALSVVDFPEISAEQIETTMEDMRAAYLEHGLSLRPFHGQWTSVGIQMGQPVDVVSYNFEQYLSLPRDAYADCLACERNGEVEYHLHVGDYEKAMATAGPLLSGEVSCAEVPQGTYAMLLFPTLERGTAEQADAYFETGYELCSTNPDFLNDISRCLIYAVATGKTERALEIFQRHVGWWRDSRITAYKLTFEVGSTMLFRTCAPKIELRLPQDVPFYQEGGMYQSEDLARFFAQRVDQNATAFDDRNGNRFVSRRVAADLERVSV